MIFLVPRWSWYLRAVSEPIAQLLYWKYRLRVMTKVIILVTSARFHGVLATNWVMSYKINRKKSCL